MREDVSQRKGSNRVLHVVLTGLVVCLYPFKTYAEDVSVQVLAVDAKAMTLTVKGAGLPNPGPAGSEVLTISAGDAAIGYVGHQVHGDLSKSMGAWWLNDIWPADPNLVAATSDATKQLHRDLVELGRKAYRDVGDQLPPFALFNQNGELVRPSTLSGRRLVIDFIFTECKDPTMCPLNTQRMVQLQKKLKDAKIDNVTLVTITFDPTHDTPGVLRQYAQGNNIDLSNFQLLTGPQDEVDEMLGQFGILLKNNDGTIQHTMATIVVSPEGRITYRKEGNLWTVDEIFQRLTPPVQLKMPK